MKIKSLILYCLISSIFLFSLVSIWKVLSTLQGIDLENFNFAIILTLGIGISLINLIVGDKFHKAIKSIIFAILFTFVDGYLLQLMPIWYNIGIFGILIFYSFKIDKYNQKNLELDHSSQTVVFEFLTLFGIVLFSFVILFPFYMMIVTSFKTQAALLINPLDFSINFAQDIKELFKSYFVIFDTYKFGRYILIIYTYQYICISWNSYSYLNICYSSSIRSCKTKFFWKKLFVYFNINYLHVSCYSFSNTFVYRI